MVTECWQSIIYLASFNNHFYIRRRAVNRIRPDKCLLMFAGWPTQNQTDGIIVILDRTGPNTFKILEPEAGWGWMTFNGVVTIALGWMILKGWPVSGAWAIGILVGIRLLFSGVAMLTLGSAGSQVARTLRDS